MDDISGISGSSKRFGQAPSLPPRLRQLKVRALWTMATVVRIGFV